MLDKRVKFLAFVLMLLACFSVLLVACGRSGSTPDASASGNSNGGPTVHMNDSNFVQPSVTISKGSSLTLVDDSAVVHIVTNGTWDNGMQNPKKEAGAPTVNEYFQGNDTKTVGPFNTAGTFQLYCTVHPGMNLTVIVK